MPHIVQWTTKFENLFHREHTDTNNGNSIQSNRQNWCGSKTRWRETNGEEEKKSNNNNRVQTTGPLHVQIAKTFPSYSIWLFWLVSISVSKRIVTFLLTSCVCTGADACVCAQERESFKMLHSKFSLSDPCFLSHNISGIHTIFKWRYRAYIHFAFAQKATAHNEEGIRKRWKFR